MKTNYEIRYAAHPEDAKSYDTARLRRGWRKRDGGFCCG